MFNRHIFREQPKFAPAITTGTDPVPNDEWKKKADATRAYLLTLDTPAIYPKDFASTYAPLDSERDADIPTFVKDENDPTKFQWNIPYYGALTSEERKLKLVQTPEGYSGLPIYQWGDKFLVADNDYIRNPEYQNWRVAKTQRGRTTTTEYWPTSVDWVAERLGTDDYQKVGTETFAWGGIVGSGKEMELTDEEIQKLQDGGAHVVELDKMDNGGDPPPYDALSKGAAAVMNRLAQYHTSQGKRSKGDVYDEMVYDGGVDKKFATENLSRSHVEGIPDDMYGMQQFLNDIAAKYGYSPVSQIPLANTTGPAFNPENIDYTPPKEYKAPVSLSEANINLLNPTKQDKEELDFLRKFNLKSYSSGKELDQMPDGGTPKVYNAYDAYKDKKWLYDYGQLALKDWKAVKSQADIDKLYEGENWKDYYDKVQDVIARLKKYAPNDEWWNTQKEYENAIGTSSYYAVTYGDPGNYKPSLEDAYRLDVDKNKYPSFEEFKADAEFYKKHGRNMTSEERKAWESETMKNSGYLAGLLASNLNTVSDTNKEVFKNTDVVDQTSTVNEIPDSWGEIVDKKKPIVDRQHHWNPVWEIDRSSGKFIERINPFKRNKGLRYSFADGGEIMELTDTEIEDLRKTGAIIVEL